MGTFVGCFIGGAILPLENFLPKLEKFPTENDERRVKEKFPIEMNQRRVKEMVYCGESFFSMYTLK